MVPGESHVHYRLINYSDCGWGSFVCHRPVSLSNMLWKSPLWRLFKGGKVNKERRWHVSPLKSHGYLSTTAALIDRKQRLKLLNNMSSVYLWFCKALLSIYLGFTFNGQDMRAVLTLPLEKNWILIVYCTKPESNQSLLEKCFRFVCVHVAER